MDPRLPNWQGMADRVQILEQVHLHTEQALYACVRPSPAYKQLYSRFAESVGICNEVISPEDLPASLLLIWKCSSNLLCLQPGLL